MQMLNDWMNSMGGQTERREREVQIDGSMRRACLMILDCSLNHREMHGFDSIIFSTNRD